jgi:LPS export ABC transporter protein LptC
MKTSNLFLLTGMLMLLILISGCGDEKKSTENTSAVTTSALEPDQVFSNAHIFLYRGGRTTTDLTADEIRQFTKLDSSAATKLTIYFFDSTGTRISTVTADSGYIKEKKKFLAVSGSVVVIGKDSVHLMTEYLEWNGAKDSVVTDSFVTIIQGSDTLMSYGFQSDPQLKDITFKQRVSGRTRIRPDELENSDRQPAGEGGNDSL